MNLFHSFILFRDEFVSIDFYNSRSFSVEWTSLDPLTSNNIWTYLVWYYLWSLLQKQEDWLLIVAYPQQFLQFLVFLLMSIGAYLQLLLWFLVFLSTRIVEKGSDSSLLQETILLYHNNDFNNGYFRKIKQWSITVLGVIDLIYCSIWVQKI